jgi:hypothetical protein
MFRGYARLDRTTYNFLICALWYKFILEALCVSVARLQNLWTKILKQESEAIRRQFPELIALELFR